MKQVQVTDIFENECFTVAEADVESVLARVLDEKQLGVYHEEAEKGNTAWQVVLRYTSAQVFLRNGGFVEYSYPKRQH